MNTPALDRVDPKNQKNFQPHGRREASINEIIDGRVTPKPAGNRWHNLIASNLTIAIGSRTNRSSVDIYAGGMQVQLGKDSVLMPDVTVVAGEPVFASGEMELLQNPAVLVEITATGAKAGARAHKLENFLAIPNVKECLLVSEDEMRVEHYARQNAKQWIYRIYNERDDVISLDSINCKLSLAEVYAQVKVRESELSSKAVN
jgi:Uma2 family endonuclease